MELSSDGIFLKFKPLLKSLLSLVVSSSSSSSSCQCEFFSVVYTHFLTAYVSLQTHTLYKPLIPPAQCHFSSNQSEDFLSFCVQCYTYRDTTYIHSSSVLSHRYGYRVANPCMNTYFGVHTKRTTENNPEPNLNLQ